MRIHINGDWAVTISSVLAGVITLRLSYLMAALYLIIGMLGAVAARRGREVPDGSTWVSWQNTNADGVDPVGVFGTVLVLCMVAVATTVSVPPGGWSVGRALIAVLIAIVVAWGIYQFNMTALVVVFTPDKTVLVLKGRPFVLSRRTYHANNWLGLHVVYEQGYSGGMYRNSPGDIYTVWGVYAHGAIELNTVHLPQSLKRADALQRIHVMVEETAARTGLPAPHWPPDQDIYLSSRD